MEGLGDTLIMNYFIDFEATQFTGEIISIGCVDENDRQFYTLVKPEKAEDITGFITDLTGIGRSELKKAPTADEAFVSLFEWLDKSAPVRFYCYGDSDAHFLERTLQHLRTFEGQLGLSVVKSALNDFSVDVRRHFQLKHCIALKKVVSYYRGREVEQVHNSLADAIFLKEIYDRSRTEEPVECPFPEYKQGADLPKIRRRITAEKDGVKLDFPSFGKASDWVMSEFLNVADKVNDKTKSKVCSRIMVAAEKERPYCGYKWSVGGE